tara:strand:- start:116 stop:505 length:390 start_codon:yes stop_codon:yes gene_type:complete
MEIYNYINEVFQSYKVLIVTLSLFVFVTWMQNYIRKPYTSMLEKKERLKINLEDEIDRRRSDRYNDTDNEFRKSSEAFDNEIDRLKQDYEKTIQEVQDDFNSSTLMEILVIVATGLSVLTIYVIIQLTS